MTPTSRESWMFHRLLHRGDDDGVAMVTAIMVMLVLLAFGSVVAVLGVNNLRNAQHDRQAGSSLGAGDAGVAQAIEYIRSNGVAGLTCPDGNPSSCSGNPAGWSNPSSPKLVPLDSAGTGCSSGGTDCAKVWVGVVQAFAPPAVKTGVYNIHSEGVYGNGPSARQLVVTVKVTPDKYPIGVFGQTLSGNGGTGIYTESLFTTGCISPIETGNGNGTRFQGIDSYWGQPAAPHTTDHISSQVHCDSRNYIQSSSATNTSPSSGACSSYSALYIDQSTDGGLINSSSPCYHQYQRPDGSWYPDGVCPGSVQSPYPSTTGLCDTTAFTTADLQRYGYQPRGLTDAQYAALKSRAQSQGTYNLDTGSISTVLTSLVNGGINNPVLYYDCTSPGSVCSGGSLTLKQSYFPTGLFDAQPAAGSCGPMRIVTIVVEHGSMTFAGGSNSWLDGAIFVPDGSFNGNGAYNVLGTLFSNNLDLGGSYAFQLSSCWVSSFPGPVMSITQTTFREDDASDLP